MSRLPHPDEAIAAIASAPGGAQRGIVRLSGLDMEQILHSCGIQVPILSPPSGNGRTPRPISVAERVEMPVPGLAYPVPAELYIWRGTRSYTGQPQAEIHLPGSPPLLEAVLAQLFEAGARPALPGEFTQRAFLSGRLDLLQAEAIPGVVDAGNQADLRKALEQLGGGVSSLITRLRGDLLDLVADLEAGLDFSEEDIEFVSSAMTVARIGLARDALESLLARANSRLRSATEARVVLAGPPNAGKSTLFNRLVGAEAAIVSNVPGTTRDYLAAEIAWDRTTFTLIDTAGCESASSAVTLEAQEHARRQIADADLVLWCQPGDAVPVDAPLMDSGRLLHLQTKADLADVSPRPIDSSILEVETPLRVSVRTSSGIEALKEAIRERIGNRATQEASFAGTTAARCFDSLTGAAAAIDRALALAREATDHDLLAIELREALEELGKITGAVYTDDILDRIFSKFCIGK